MILLNYRDSKPIYEQVKEGIHKLVSAGALDAGEKLPSAGELASRLAINPGMVVRAYRELVAEGCLYTADGTEVFVSADRRTLDCRTTKLLEEFDEVVEELFFLSVPPEFLKERVGTLDERGQDE